MSYNRHDVICYCKPNGGAASGCSKCKDPPLQKLCGFYEDCSQKRCLHLKFSEYCGSYLAADFADGKDIPHNLIPNFTPKSPASSMSHYPIDRDGNIIRQFQSTKGYPKRHGTVGHHHTIPAHKHGEESVSGHTHSHSYIVSEKDLEDGEKQEQELFESEYEQCFAGLESVHPDVLKGDHDEDTAELIWEFEEWEMKHENPCKEVRIDNSGNMTAAEFQKLSSYIVDALESDNWTRPIDKVVEVRYLREMLDLLCCAFDSKHGLFLDMSNPNIYTIYKQNGYFISLRDLYKDGIYPLDLDFRMIDGIKDFKEYGLDSFQEMIPEMLNSGR